MMQFEKALCERLLVIQFEKLCVRLLVIQFESFLCQRLVPEIPRDSWVWHVQGICLIAFVLSLLHCIFHP